MLPLFGGFKGKPRGNKDKGTPKTSMYLSALKAGDLLFELVGPFGFEGKPKGNQTVPFWGSPQKRRGPKAW